MPRKKYRIRLNEQERAELLKAAQSNRRSVREKTRARALLLSDESRPRCEDGSVQDGEIAARLGCSSLTVSNIRRRACERGALESIRRDVQKHRKARKLDGRGEAALVAVTCSSPPTGRARWSLRLLRERLIEMEVVENIGLETVRTTLKKTHSNRGSKRCGASPPKRMHAL